jgi:4-amino-4-deoxy-L-arabinose transferase-like glycosyltransferase
MNRLQQIQETANCKLQIAICNLKERAMVRSAGRSSPSATAVPSQFAICNLQFAICNVLLLLLCSVLFLHRLADRDLWNSHEGRAAQDAQSVLDQPDWRMPRLFSGEPEMQKPPLYYWMVAGVAWVRNVPVDALAVRLPAALAATACVLVVYLWCFWRGRAVTGFIAALVLATAMHFTWLGRVGRIDMPLTFCICVALFTYYASTGGNTFILILAYIAVAAGILLKGPIAVALPGVAIAVHLAIEKELPLPWHLRRCLALARRLGLWWGIPLIGALVLPWFLWANAETAGEWCRTFFWRHNFERGITGDGEDHWNHPWWLYGPMFFWDFLPWSVFLPVAVWLFYRNGWWRQDRLARFAFIWFIAITGLLSFMRFKRDDYLLPAFPGAALFLGCVAERWSGACSLAHLTKHQKRASLVFGVIVIVCVAGWLVNLSSVMPRAEPTREYQRFAERIREFAPPEQPVLFFRTDRHALVFHVGQPVEVFVEWEKLDAWTARPEPVYVVMPALTVSEWPLHLTSGRLEEVARNTSPDGREHEKPLVLLRTRSNNHSGDP